MMGCIDSGREINTRTIQGVGRQEWAEGRYTEFREIVERDFNSIVGTLIQVREVTLEWLIDYDGDGEAWDERRQDWIRVGPDHGNLSQAQLFVDW